MIAFLVSKSESDLFSDHLRYFENANELERRLDDKERQKKERTYSSPLGDAQRAPGTSDKEMKESEG